MKYGQHRAITDGVKELVRMPRSGERACFGLTVSNNYADDQVWIIERGAERMRYAVPQFAAFMNGTGHFRRAVTAQLTRKRKSLEQPQHASFILALFRINFRVCSFEVAVRNHRWRAVAWA